MIWDLHCHLTSPGQGDTASERARRLIEIGDRHGIERYCVYMGLKFSPDPSPDDLRRQNDAVLEAIEAFPDRLFGFVYLNPKHVQTSLDELERCVAKGPMVGVKLWIAQSCADPTIDPIIKRAAELNAVIFQHAWYKTGGNNPGESTPDDVATLAKRFPNLPLVCGHTGGNWELGIPAIRAHKNISIGIAGSDPTAGFVEMAVRELGAERILYGSDAPGRSFASQLAKVLGANISQKDKNLILGGNLKKLLLPILKDKGIKI
ncbi:MAG: amidohydrolase family protein [Verrucomicrobia bacterium]|nr:amidohydrolase family protein [Verrucomicrobiota bacterium]